jgi:hypothetical protein
MDAHSVTASFSAAARLAKQQQQQQQLWSTPAAADSSHCQIPQQLRDVLESYLLPLLQMRLQQMDPVGLQVVLHALATLQYQEELVISQLVRSDSIDTRAAAEPGLCLQHVCATLQKSASVLL